MGYDLGIRSAEEPVDEEELRAPLTTPMTPPPPPPPGGNGAIAAREPMDSREPMGALPSASPVPSPPPNMLAVPSQFVDHEIDDYNVAEEFAGSQEGPGVREFLE